MKNETDSLVYVTLEWGGEARDEVIPPRQNAIMRGTGAMPPRLLFINSGDYATEQYAVTIHPVAKSRVDCTKEAYAFRYGRWSGTRELARRDGFFLLGPGVRPAIYAKTPERELAVRSAIPAIILVPDYPPWEESAETTSEWMGGADLIPSSAIMDATSPVPATAQLRDLPLLPADAEQPLTPAEASDMPPAATTAPPPRCEGDEPEEPVACP